jgi:glycosyltransferase involved in cell wall biosynthesis
MPKITVLVAAYRSAMLARTLDSVAAQTFDDFEVLVLDDANSEDCRRLVERYADSRFVYVGNPVNLGPAKNHLMGLERASGEFAAILNHDDLWEPRILEHLVAELERFPDAVAAFARARVAGVDGSFDVERTEAAWRQWDCAHMPDGLIPDWFAVNTSRLGFPIVSTSLVRTSVARSIPIPSVVGGAYDYWLAYRIARSGPVIHVPDAVGYWREHPGNLSHHRSARKVFETVYIDTVAARDGRVPRNMRLAAFGRIPRGLAAVGKQAVRDAQRRVKA